MQNWTHHVAVSSSASAFREHAFIEAIPVVLGLGQTVMLSFNLPRLRSNGLCSQSLAKGMVKELRTSREQADLLSPTDPRDSMFYEVLGASGAAKDH